MQSQGQSQFLTRGKLLGLAGALVMGAMYFGTVVWVGQDLAASVKAGTREIPAGIVVADSES